ncbi:hypothetical protein vseg_020749 [Gypsophila vaccaria]
MASKRCVTTLTRQITTSISSQSLKILVSFIPKTPKTPPKSHLFPNLPRFYSSNPPKNPHFTSPSTQNDNDNDNDTDDNDDDDDDDEEDYSSGGEEEEEIDGNVGKLSVNEPSCFEERSYNVEEKILEAADIGYQVVGPLMPEDRVFKHYEPAFAVVQIGSHQFKVSNGDCIYVEKLKYCEVNDKLILNKVMMVGSPTQTIIGRPILPEAAVHAIVEEHALDAKVIIFKKKRRKNYRRTKGHRQELTRLRITDIQGIEKIEAPLLGKSSKTSAKKVEKVAVPA